MMRKVTYRIVSSVNGLIADSNGDISWVDEVSNPNKLDYGFKEFYDSIDILLMGYKTYEKIASSRKSWPFSFKDTYVITWRTDLKNDSNVHFITSDIISTVRFLKSQGGRGIWLLGGGIIASMLLHENLIDEFMVQVVPTVVGDGYNLFAPTDKIVPLHLIENQSFDNGMVLLRYGVTKTNG